MTHQRVTAFWHKDPTGHCNPHELIGTQFVHISTSTLYVVEAAMFNATSQKWCLCYDRMNNSQRKEFGFVRDMDQFLDGRFVKVE